MCPVVEHFVWSVLGTKQEMGFHIQLEVQAFIPIGYLNTLPESCYTD